MAATKINPRVNLSVTELNELRDFILLHKDGLSEPMDKLFKKICLILYKLDMDMPVSGYKVLAKKKPLKYSMEGLGLDEQELSSQIKENVVLDTDEARATFNEQFSKMFLQTAEQSNTGEPNNEQS